MNTIKEPPSRNELLESINTKLEQLERLSTYKKRHSGRKKIILSNIEFYEAIKHDFVVPNIVDGFILNPNHFTDLESSMSVTDDDDEYDFGIAFRENWVLKALIMGILIGITIVIIIQFVIAIF